MATCPAQGRRHGNSLLHVFGKCKKLNPLNAHLKTSRRVTHVFLNIPIHLCMAFCSFFIPSVTHAVWSPVHSPIHWPFHTTTDSINVLSSFNRRSHPIVILSPAASPRALVLSTTVANFDGQFLLSRWEIERWHAHRLVRPIPPIPPTHHPRSPAVHAPPPAPLPPRSSASALIRSSCKGREKEQKSLARPPADSPGSCTTTNLSHSIRRP